MERMRLSSENEEKSKGDQPDEGPSHRAGVSNERGHLRTFKSTKRGKEPYQEETTPIIDKKREAERETMLGGKKEGGVPFRPPREKKGESC